jgi:type I restriction enzyme, S subunit
LGSIWGKMSHLSKRVLLEEVAEIQTGISKSSQRQYRDPVEIPYLRVANVQDGHLDLSEIKTIEVERSNVDRYKLKYKDVLLTEGGDFDKLGRGTIWKNEISECIHQNHIFVVRPDPKKLLPEYLSLITSSHYGKQYFISCSKQSTNLASINSTQLKQFPINLPPLPEQQKIADILSTWDEAIQKLERLIELKEKFFDIVAKSLIIDSKANEVKTLGEIFNIAVNIEKGKNLTKTNLKQGSIPVVAGGQSYAYYHNRSTHTAETITISASGRAISLIIKVF